MSLLSDEFYTNLAKTPRMTGPRVMPQATPEVQPEKTSWEKKEDVATEFITKGQEKSVAATQDISPEEQIAKFGGVVGSPEYLKYQGERSFLGRMPGEIFQALPFVGGTLPDQEKWDKMSIKDKLFTLTNSINARNAEMIVKLPRQVVAGAARVGYTAYKEATTIGGLLGDKKTEMNLPYVGSIPTYYKSYETEYKSAKEAGYGAWAPVLAAINTVTLAAGDLSMTASMGAGIKSALTPKTKIINGLATPTIDVAPVKQIIVKNEFGLKSIRQKAEGSQNIYRRVTPEYAKEMGGTVDNIFWKISPKDFDGNFEASIVKIEPSAIPKGVTKVISKVKGKNTVEGDFGLESKLTKFDFSLAKINPQAFADWQKEFVTTKQEVGWAGGKDKVVQESYIGKKGSSVEKNIMDAETRLNELVKEEAKVMSDLQKEFGGVSLVEGAEGAKLRMSSNPPWYQEFYKAAGRKPGKAEILGLAKEQLEKGSGMFSKEYQGIKTLVEDLKKGESEPKIPEMPEGYGVSTEQPSLRQFTPRSKPLPGMEKNIITADEMRHLDTIIKYTKIDPELAKVVIKAVTGKDVMGELTHGEYIKAQNALSLFENSNRYLGPEPNINPIMLDLKSAKPAFQDMQNKLGVPIYEDIFVRMEDSMRALKRFKEKEFPLQADLYKITKGKNTVDYGSANFADKRRLIMAYGEKYPDAISKNTLLSPKEKIDLLEIAKRTKAKLDEYADIVGMKKEERIQDYMPHIKNRGGIYDIEKAGSGFPGESTPFFEYQRGGSLEAVVDDPLALLNIYASALGKKIYLSENLGKMKAVYDSIPSKNLIEKEYALDYVQTRLGYIGKTEAYLNKWAAGVNKKLGTNLPPDFARKFMQVEMDTIYSGAMGANPVTAVRNVFGQLPLVLARTGTEDLAWAWKMSRSKAGMAEVAEKGFLTEHGGVYGIDLAKEAELTGRIGSNYRRLTQGSLSLVSKSDTAVRNLTYFLSKAKWNRAMEKINSGKISWEQWEKEVDLGSMNPIDQQIVRKALAEGKHEVAFDHITRDIIDSTNFHYRSANSPRWMWETKGKQLGMFAQYPIEYFQTLGHWLKTGQYDKFIKFYGISTGFKRTAEDTFGMDISKWMNLGPMAVGMTPVLKFMYETLMTGVSYLNDNPEEFEKHKDAIVKEITNLGIPMGVQGNRLYDFQRDIRQSEKDNLPIGTYGVYDRQGKLIYKTNFSGLFSGVLLGFPTKEKMQESETLKNMMNSKWESSDAKKTMMKLLRDGKIDEATKIMVEFGVVPTQQDYDSYYIPRNQRIWNTLPKTKKPQFAPKIFK